VPLALAAAIFALQAADEAEPEGAAPLASPARPMRAAEG
jgi:hypothetical protein